jgi:hypothetical protein
VKSVLRSAHAGIEGSQNSRSGFRQGRGPAEDLHEMMAKGKIQGQPVGGGFEPFERHIGREVFFYKVAKIKHDRFDVRPGRYLLAS